MVRRRHASGHAGDSSGSEPAAKPQALDDQARIAIDEARMVLPGIQALFGFQLIAVFNQRFADLGSVEQTLHFAALALVAVSIALIMAPAAYHRIAEPTEVSRLLVELASRLISAAMLPLMFAIAIDLGLVAWMVMESVVASAVAAAGVVLLYAWLWFALPLRSRRARRQGSAG